MLLPSFFQELGTMKRALRLFSVVSLVAFCGSILAADASAPWPTFRGPTRTAVAPDTGLLKSWPEGGPKLVWESVGVGQGFSSLAIADGRIYTMGDNSSITGIRTLTYSRSILKRASRSGRQSWDQPGLKTITARARHRRSMVHESMR
jgi:hypothetical protein